MLIPGLIAVWVVALGWYAVAGHSGSARSEHSIGSFERHLRGLRSHSGLLVSPANRLSFPGEMRSTVSVSSASFRHAELNRRRRNVLGALLGSLAFLGLVGFITHAAGSWCSRCRWGAGVFTCRTSQRPRRLVHWLNVDFVPTRAQVDINLPAQSDRLASVNVFARTRGRSSVGRAPRSQ